MTLKSDYRSITSRLLEQLDEDATTQVDCKLHGKFRHAPINLIPEGDCPDCYFQDEYLKEIALPNSDWISKSELH